MLSLSVIDHWSWNYKVNCSDLQDISRDHDVSFLLYNNIWKDKTLRRLGRSDLMQRQKTRLSEVRHEFLFNKSLLEISQVKLLVS